MIRLWVFSDIHAEFFVGKRDQGAPVVRPDDADVVVIAGDTHHAVAAVDTARRLVGPDLPIVIVAGNHEHYGLTQPVPRGVALMREAAQRYDRTWVLENATIELEIRDERVRFIGATMWVDFALFGDPSRFAEYGRRGLTDFSEILNADPPYFAIRPRDMIQWFKASRTFIEAELRKEFDGSTVVVTHHAPSIRSVAQRYRKGPLSPCFASDCDDLLGLGADVWVHGHTHDSFDYEAGSTRVVCNPRGYPLRGAVENRNFDPSLVIEVGRR